MRVSLLESDPAIRIGMQARKQHHVVAERTHPGRHHAPAAQNTARGCRRGNYLCGSVLGREPGHIYFNDVARNPTSIQIPGLLILRPNEGIFFANASGLQDAIMSLVAAQETPAQAVVLDLEMSNELDAPGAEMLHDLHADLSCQEIQLMLARVRPPVLAMLERSGTLDNIGAENVYVRR
jgi:MFS superfamily sulfate permease-like transporter